MARYRGPKNRLARRFQANIFGRARNPLLHKANPPGMHGAKKKKKSDFGMMLDEQQKLKAIYGMLTRKQLINAYKKAANSKENTVHKFLELLECRLDNVVYRLRFAQTIFGAHQLVSHGHIQVNGRKVDRRSFIVRPGMVVSIKEKSRAMKAVQMAQENQAREVPSYLALADDRQSGELLSAPHLDQVPFALPVNLAQVCDFLSHTS